LIWLPMTFPRFHQSWFRKSPQGSCRAHSGPHDPHHRRPRRRLRPRRSGRSHHHLPHKDRTRLAHRPRPRPLRPPLGDRQTAPLLNPSQKLDRNHPRKQGVIETHPKPKSIRATPELRKSKPKVSSWKTLGLFEGEGHPSAHITDSPDTDAQM
jgi:hypothetical protein